MEGTLCVLKCDIQFKVFPSSHKHIETQKLQTYKFSFKNSKLPDAWALYNVTCNSSLCACTTLPVTVVCVPVQRYL